MPLPRAVFRQAAHAAVGAVVLGVLLFIGAPAAANPAPAPAPSSLGVYGRTGSNPGHLTDPGSPLEVPVAPAPTPPPGAARDNRSRLPTTGLDVSGVVTLGVAMVLAGVLMLTVRRRGPRSTLAPLPPDDDYTWHAPTQELPIWNRSTSD